jgi:uncharacterized membrane protein YhaH (DUF805 family)
MQDNNPYQAPGANVYDVAAEGADETNPFSPAGRFGRLSYIAWTTLVGILFNIISVIFAGGVAALADPAVAGGSLLLLGVISLAFMVVYALFGIRRLHDINASGWWLLLLLVPVANIILALVMLIKSGTIGGNNFGAPRITRTWEKVVGIIGIVFMALAVVGIIAAIALPMMMA